MASRRFTWLAVFLSSLCLYAITRHWLLWFTMNLTIFLPLLSLALSLPAICTLQVTLQCPPKVQMGMPCRITMEKLCRFPAPVIRCRLRVCNAITAEGYVGIPGERVPTAHCGAFAVEAQKTYVYDYLGLFCFPIKRVSGCHVTVFPKPISGKLPDMEAGESDASLKPKAGGGYAENHDLRPYRPGDDLRQLHWKMSAKTDSLIYREPMISPKERTVLALSLFGTEQQLDDKLGRLLWLSQRLLEQAMEHDIVCRTGEGVLQLSVADRRSLEYALTTILHAPQAQLDLLPESADARIRVTIGGEADGS